MSVICCNYFVGRVVMIGKAAVWLILTCLLAVSLGLPTTVGFSAQEVIKEVVSNSGDHSDIYKNCFSPNVLRRRHVILHRRRRHSAAAPFTSTREKTAPFSAFAFTAEPQSMLVCASGGSVTFDCAVRSDETTSPDRIAIEWRKDSRPLKIDDNRWVKLTNGSLVINRLMLGSDDGSQEDDAGSYQCLATAEGIGTLQSRKAQLRKTCLRKRAFVASHRTVDAGSRVFLKCPVESSTKLSISWFKNGVELSPASNSRVSIIAGTGSLEIRDVALEDDGSYRCKASLSNQRQDKTSELSVDVVRLSVLNREILSEPSEPDFETRPQSSAVAEGSSVTLECAANGYLDPQIKWLKDQKLLEVDNRFRINGQGSLVIEQVRVADAGQYICRAMNAEDSVDANVILTVEVPPKLIRGPKSLIAKETDDVLFECDVSGIPKPVVSWIRNGESLTSSDYFQIEGSKLRILGLVLSDAGLFQCLAENAAGSVYGSAQLIVQPSGKNRTSAVDGATSFEASARHRASAIAFGTDASENVSVANGEQRETMTLATLNQASASTLTEILPAGTENGPSADSGDGVWSAPRDLRSVVITSRQITLEWERPTYSKGEIQAYNVYYRQIGSERERLVISSKPNLEEVTIAGLLPGTSYQFRVVPSAKAGLGVSSSVLVAQTIVEPTLCGKVKHLKAETMSATSIEVVWEPPVGDRRELKMYKLYYLRIYDQAKDDASAALSASNRGNNDDDNDDSRFGDEVTELQLASPSYVFHGLDPFAVYAFRVEAQCKRGVGPSSETVEARTFSDVPSGAPLNVTADAQSSTSALIAWLPPPRLQQNGVITAYKIRWKARTRLLQGRSFTTEGDARSYLIEDLAPGTIFSIKVAAVTQNGTGPFQTVSVTTLDQDRDESQVPGAPEQLRALSTKSREISVMWTPPIDDSTMVRGYILGWGIGIPDVQTAKFDDKRRQFTIENLKPEKQYIISLRAYNKLGNGFPLYETVHTVENVTPEPAYPLEPLIGVRAVTLSANSIQLSWLDRELAPTTYGGETQKNTDGRIYTIRYTTQAHHHGRYRFVNSSETSFTIDGLRPWTQYEFSVKSVKGRRESSFSMAAYNTTFAAAPASAPRDLTVVTNENNPSGIILNWQPPKQANGPITGYMLFYTNEVQRPDREWKVEGLPGDRLTASLENLLPETLYWIKLQARNEKGYGPQSPVQQHRTPSSASLTTGYRFGVNGPRLHSTESSGDESSATNSNPNFLSQNILIVALASGLSALAVVVLVVVGICVCRSNSRRRRRSGYKAGVKKHASANGKQDVLPSDLWIDNDHRKSAERNPPESQLGSIQDLKINDPAHLPPYEMPRFDLLLGGRTSQSTDSSGYGSVTLDFRSSRLMNHRPIGLASPHFQSENMGDDSFSNGTLPRNYPKPPSNLNLQKPVYGTVVYTGPKLQSNFDQASHSSRSPFGSSMVSGSSPPPPPSLPLPPLSTAASSSLPSRSESVASGDQPQRSTAGLALSMLRGTNPLSSFILPMAPPPLTSPTPRHIVRPLTSAPISSSYNASSMSHMNDASDDCCNLNSDFLSSSITCSSNANGAKSPGACHGLLMSNNARLARSPLSVSSPRVPTSGIPSALSDSNYSSGRDTDTEALPFANSTEELNVQMQNLDTLMKDLSAISRSQFDVMAAS